MTTTTTWTCATSRFLATREVTFYAPLGVGAHVEGWGVKPERLVEMEWWQEVPLGFLSSGAEPKLQETSGLAETAVRVDPTKERTPRVGVNRLGLRHFVVPQLRDGPIAPCRQSESGLP